MSVSFGFYNSLNGDRKYNATQLSSIFDGLIIDGVFATVGNAFIVQAAGGNSVTVGTGRAWFNHTWTLNDSVLSLTASESDIMSDRIDAVILEINASEEVRENTIKIINGVPASEPSRPTLIHTDLINQYALCYIYRKAGSTEITQGNITNAVGSDATPFVMGTLNTISMNDLSLQWQSQLDELVANKTSEIDEWTTREQDEFNNWRSVEQGKMDEWSTNEQADFETWFENLNTILDGDVAANLAGEIEQIKKEIRSNIIFIDLPTNSWVNDTEIDGSYVQTITINGATADTKIDLQPNATVFNQLISDGVAVLYAENDNGVIRIRTIDGKPTVDITIQATVSNAYMEEAL